MINFEFKYDAQNDYETIFTKYDELLAGKMGDKTVLNYISSHDDGGPFDLNRSRAIESGTKLLLCPGGVQVYYGDETARSLTVEAQGDATLRSFMNWEEIEADASKGDYTVQEVLSHWQKLGQFRADHPAIGAGRHQQITADPYVFSRTHPQGDQIVVGLDLPSGKKTISVDGIFEDGDKVRDAYSGQSATVRGGEVSLENAEDVVLLERLE